MSGEENDRQVRQIQRVGRVTDQRERTPELGNFHLANLISQADAARRRRVLLLGIALNLAGLIVFKYTGFLLESWNAVAPFARLPVPDIHLPIGISFFTFHAISYLVDVYRGDFLPERKAINVLLYIAMFPQLIAGPIVRFGTVRKEIHARAVTAEKVALGIKFFIIGLGQKVLLANTLAVPVDAIYKLPVEALDAPLAWLAAAGYTLQIYFDFAGYSNMAIGLGLMIGLYFPLNFNYPYVAQSITEFWRRWHITLFVVWGLYHGLFLIIERAGLGAALWRIGRGYRHLYTVLVVTVGWAFFRADTVEQALRHLRAMAGFGSGDGVAYHVWLYLHQDVALALIIGTIAATPFLARLGQHILKVAGKLYEGERKALPAWGGWCAVAGLYAVLLLSAISIASGSYNPFIYFRF